MKQKTKPISKLVILVVALLSSCSSCKKTDPPVSFNPGYHFYCKVDGVVFNPEYETGIGTETIRTKLLFGDSVLSISADKLLENVRFSIWTGNTIQIGTHSLFPSLNKINIGIYDKNSTDLIELTTDSTHTGYINITQLDKTNKLVAGDFEFDAYNATTNDTVHITEGKFNLYYKLN